MLSTNGSSTYGRFSTLKSIAEPPPRKTKSMKGTPPYRPISEYFGELTFGLGHMRERLPKEDYLGLLRTLEQGKKFTPDVADSIAQVVKEWAVSKGATHFCHWFQPMTGLTAEKHDAFISIQHSNHSELKVIERFTGGQLIQGEPDASSFPSGGMRSTFEARGYTAWDPSSPLFIVEGEQGKTLCIPSVFFGYHGEALDNKTPLLRSLQVLSREACDFLKLLGDVDVKSVSATLGTEQEYFLIDRRFVPLRPDLIMTGRTLLGAPSPRGQQLEDHYFGAIPSRVKTFMEDLEEELYKLGVPIKTRHNEVAPSQFELAPIFENVNVAADHNALTMETLKRVANRHGLMCLLHEKPFAGINGSGKHCNWSIANDKGENLLEPGTTPHQNLRFLAVMAVVLKAVFAHADALRASIATPGNDHRLGANEAPPGIISVFLGSMLDKIFDSIEKGLATGATESQIINLGISQIPDISKDYTDRNRTSPFAFTGNKFEFRAVGASANVSVPVSVLNAAIADTFREATTRLKTLLGQKSTRDEAVIELVRDLAKESRAVRFEGNNYSEEWQKEAKKRGLPVLASTVDALEVFNTPEAVEFLINTKVLSKDEIASRYHVAVERYVKTVDIELATLREMVTQYVIPAVETQLSRLSTVHEILKTTKVKQLHEKRAKHLELTFGEILAHLETLGEVLEKAHKLSDETKKMQALAKEALPVGNELRKACDAAELATADDLWPLPKYREMLFTNTIT
jgi:glutamine synthetase